MSHDHPHHHGLSRRTFLGRGACAALSSLPLFSTLLNLRLTSSLMATTSGPNDYKALVCIFLLGGNDSFNMLVPRSSATPGGDTTGTYDEYSAIRGDLALPRANLKPITENDPGTGGTRVPTNTQGGRLFGLHPGMGDVAQLFNDGNLAFIANAGTLLRPTTKQNYTNNEHLPVGLFSHSDQQEQWQTCISDKRSAIGWAGRAADIIAAAQYVPPYNNSTSKVSMNISIAGTNIFQTGKNVFTYSVDPTGSVALNGYDPLATSGLDELRTAAVDSMLEQIYHNVLEDTFRGNMRTSLDAQAEFKKAIDSYQIPDSTTTTPSRWPTGGGELDEQLRLVARVIGSRNNTDNLKANRQIFFVGIGGWDHHDDTLVNQAAMLPLVSKAMKNFWNELVYMGAQNQVTTFQASDFGRTLSSNTKGSDHAWGGNYMLMGGAVRGGRIHGAYPELYSGNPRDVGRGRLIPSISVDEISRDLLRWFGIPESQMTNVLPNIRAFRSETDDPLGLML